MLFAFIAMSSSLGALAAPVRDVGRVHVGRIGASDVFFEARGLGLPDNGVEEKVEGIIDNLTHGSVKARDELNPFEGVAGVAAKEVKEVPFAVAKTFLGLDDQLPSDEQGRRSL